MVYARLRGILIEIQEQTLVLEVQGVGYLLHFPESKTHELPALGSELTLYTSFVVREFSHTLFGFLQRVDRDLFELLLSISGIGPKTALALVSHLTLKYLQQAVTTSDVQLLCQTPGIGKKTAERLIIELKNKIFNINSPEVSSSTTHSNYHTALTALINLGFPPKQAETALGQVISCVQTDADVPTLIAAALRSSVKRS